MTKTEKKTKKTGKDDEKDIEGKKRVTLGNNNDEYYGDVPSTHHQSGSLCIRLVINQASALAYKTRARAKATPFL